jgi:hypothetical protein
MSLTLKSGSKTPWGSAQSAQELAPGIWSVSTAGHGGLKLDRARHAQLPPECRREGGWFEEDCEIYIPFAFFLEELRKAIPSLKHDDIVAGLARWERKALAALVAAGKVQMTDKARAIVAEEEAREAKAAAAKASNAPVRWAAETVAEGRVHVLFRRADGSVEGRYMAAETYHAIPLGVTATPEDFAIHGPLETAPADFAPKVGT